MTVNKPLTGHLLATYWRHPKGKIRVIRFLELSYQFLKTNKKCSFGFSYAGLHKIYCLIVLNSRSPLNSNTTAQRACNATSALYFDSFEFFPPISIGPKR